MSSVGCVKRALFYRQIAFHDKQKIVQLRAGVRWVRKWTSVKRICKSKNKLKMSNLIDLKNPVFSSYVLWSSVLVLKMLGMSLLTAVQRFKNKVSYLFIA